MEDVDWILRLVSLMREKMTDSQLKVALDGNQTGTLYVDDALLCIETSAQQLGHKITELEEYKFMYEGLEK